LSTAYFARGSGPLKEDADPYSDSENQGPPDFPSNRAVMHVPEAYFIPGRSGPEDNGNIKDILTTIAGYGSRSIGTTHIIIPPTKLISTAAISSRATAKASTPLP